MKPISRSFLLLTIPLWFSAQSVSAVEVETALKPDGKWTARATRTVQDLPAAVAKSVDTNLSQYGGMETRKTKATGFFHTEKITGRWWLVDPEGCLFIHKGVASISPGQSSGEVAAMNTKFGDVTNWAAQTTSLLQDHGFNGAGGWSAYEKLRTASHPLVYTRLVSFMAGYGKKRGGTFSQPGHTGYPNDCIFIFDPGFATYCEDTAKQLATTKDDPWLLGYFSDNEMPLSQAMLRNYLKLPDSDFGHKAALEWLLKRYGATAVTNNITVADEREFMGVVAGRYFETVSRAIKKNDPNHLYLGSRLYGANLRYPEIFQACGQWVDVVSVNYYSAWSPDPAKLTMWEREAKRPIIITEWYAKGMDSGMPNIGGAGWVVKTQKDRGLFYENFTLGLLESRACVGWHWFKYMDNDPDDKKVDASNRDSNKGVVSNRYIPYEPLLGSMKNVNVRAYSLIKFFDGAEKKKAGELSAQ